VYPCDAIRPTASNLNFDSGETIPNAVVTKLAADGTVCIYAHATAHFVVDVAGVLPSTTFVPLAAPQRLLETRPGETTSDGQQQGAGARGGGTSTRVQVTGRAGVPDTATAVVLNVTVTQAQASGFATVFPVGATRPTASNLNYKAGDTVPNAVVARIGVGGSICVFTLATAHYIVDIAGYLTGALPPTGSAECPAPEVPPPSCDPSYPTVCIPPPPPDLDCGEIAFNDFAVSGSDPHGFDGDHDGIGCETGGSTTLPPPNNCHPSYPTVCIPPPPPDLDCPDIPFRRFAVVGSDPHRFDADHDGVGCET
jgi:hypothetical protein